ncbi:hypothetical protein J22TS3_25790 [Paenibacillus sp. J22TS3]|nr:hypothetical protein J22TS3_25790 [Paenibacillus sp. J22TS3]
MRIGICPSISDGTFAGSLTVCLFKITDKTTSQDISLCPFRSINKTVNRITPQVTASFRYKA